MSEQRDPKRERFLQSILKHVARFGWKRVLIAYKGKYGKKPDLQGLNLTGLYIGARELDFRGLDLSGMNFSGARLPGALFDGADLTAANFNRATVTDARFIQATLCRADLRGGVFHRSRFGGSDLTDAMREGAQFEQGALHVVKGLE